MTPDYYRLENLIATQPEAAWAGLKAFVSGGGPLLESQALLEDLVSQHAAQFIDDIAAEAEADPRFAEVAALAYVGDVSGPAADRFRAVQLRLMDRLGITHWEGFMPLPPHEGATTDNDGPTT
jgi:hypothetical protein